MEAIVLLLNPTAESLVQIAPGRFGFHHIESEVPALFQAGGDFHFKSLRLLVYRTRGRQAVYATATSGLNATNAVVGVPCSPIDHRATIGQGSLSGRHVDRQTIAVEEFLRRHGGIPVLHGLE